MTTQTTNDSAMSWPAKPRRVTQAENAAARKKVQEAANRAREERIKGRPNAWTTSEK